MELGLTPIEMTMLPCRSQICKHMKAQKVKMTLAQVAIKKLELHFVILYTSTTVCEIQKLLLLTF